jgi:hypothetical protein
MPSRVVFEMAQEKVISGNLIEYRSSIPVNCCVSPSRVNLGFSA